MAGTPWRGSIGCVTVGVFVIGYIAWKATTPAEQPAAPPPTIRMSPPPGAPTPHPLFPTGADTILNGFECRTGELVVPTVTLWAVPGDFATPGQRAIAKRSGTTKADRCRGDRVRILGTQVVSQGVTFVRVLSDGVEGWVSERLIHPAK